MEIEHIVHAEDHPLQTNIDPERAGWQRLGFQVRALGVAVRPLTPRARGTNSVWFS